MRNTEQDAGKATPRTLAIVVPSIHDRAEPWAGLLERLKTLPGYEECRWEIVHHRARWHRPGRAVAAARRVAADIHQRWVTDGPYDRVVLVGHSLGGMLVRYAYLSALGTFDDDHRRDWATAVDRVVLFASLNRGIEVSWRRAWWLPMVAWMSRILPLTRRWLAHDLLRGSEFVTNLRIAWLREINAMSRPPVMYQFLGNSDGLVSMEDSRDIDVFPTGVQEEVPDGTHGNLIRLDVAPDPDARFALISTGFTTPRPESVPEVGKADQRVVIVLHGIRASNDTWPRELETLIEQGWPDTEVIAATYGRFSARRFLLPVTRRKFLGWMQDTYAERLAVNPKATFHFIGHSNGTYLLGHSLRRIPSMRFDHVLLVSSVLPTKYNWADLRGEQVKRLRNDRAASDIPVGVLCSGLRGLFMRDIGPAGVRGFDWDDPMKAEVYYYQGGHSKALDHDNLPGLAEFVMTGTSSAPDGLVGSPRFALLSNAAPYLFFVLALGLVAAFVFVALLGPGPLLLALVTLLVIYFVLDVV